MGTDTESTEQLRAQAALLISQARSQAQEIAYTLASVSAALPVHADLSATAGQISDVIRRLSEALQSARFPLRPSDLMALQSAVASADVRALVADAKAAQANMAGMQAVATASAATRGEVETDARDFFDRNIFDRYLHFSSRQDEEEFRQREAAARKYVEEQLAKKTPEGDLNAAGGMQSYMLDAHAHGAGASPDFLPKWNAIAEKAERQRDAMRATGQSTVEYDRRIDESVRRYLHQKGVPEAEIDDRLAHAANPIDAAGISAPAKAAARANLVDKVAAKLKAAGVQMGDDAGIGHGLTAVGSGKAVEAPARAP